MERGQEQAMTGRKPSIVWQVVGQYLPLAALALAAVLIYRQVADDGPSEPPSVSVDADHSARLAANIAFFEGRVVETKDSLSYNKLTGLYLQRLRETGDVSDVRRAELSATKSLEAAPKDYAGLIGLATVRIAQHDFADAERLALQAQQRVPGRADANAILGDAQMALGRYDEAGENYRLFLDNAPGSSAFSRQAAIAEVRGNLPLAEQFWKAAMDADRADAPENAAWARVQLGTLYFTTGKLDLSKEQLESALRVYPGYPSALAGLGRVAAARGDYSQAIERYRAANAGIPQPEYVAALADVYTRDGKPGPATQQAALMGVFSQLFQANGIRNDLTLILFDLDHGQASPATVDRARLAYEERPSLAAADIYAWALYRTGNLDEAEAYASQALRLGTQEPLYLFHAAVIAAARGDSTAARLRIERVLALNPQFAVLQSTEAAALAGQLKGTGR